MTDTQEVNEEDQTLINFTKDADHIRVKTELGHVISEVGDWLLTHNEISVSDLEALIKTLMMIDIALSMFIPGKMEEPNG